MMWFEMLSPLSGAANLSLILLSLVTAWINSAMGIGGSALLIMSMAQIMPPAAVIPVHGMVQLGANSSRFLFIWRYVDYKRLLAIVPGILLGALLAGWLLVQLPPGTLELLIASFMLFMCWGPTLPARSVGMGGSMVMGALTTFLSSFVGAAGSIVAAYLKHISSERMVRVATHSAVMSLQHLTKAFIFGFAGFVFVDWLALMGLMIAVGFVGTWAGLKVLKKLTNNKFDFIMKVLLTLLAVRLLWIAFEKLVLL
ncbi:sulfite exporter TauE/SafE family protein [Vreelandella nanhaiensis]|uniref:Probable membrane transporter protein n=1 Tax=Vreelandella nanhaiensis TaxID=1258546 RepID=A0A433KRN0_9GAMM|nr:sulfite exporter TauE/SafE family protein [Halomonas nanhaiensis]RUR32265.1 sulfite exporter TauE/SafE family protein [Halomonas nanhaiensis]